MPARRSLVSLAAFALLLAACAPAVLGSRSNPVDLRHTDRVPAVPGSTVYVLVPFDHGSFGYRPDDLSGRWIPWGADAAAASVTALFSVGDVLAPDGWRLSIDQVRAFDRRGRTGVAFEATLILDVPSGARLGGQRVRATLEARNGGRETFELIVQVAP